ncbi:hypothetical protein GF337_20045 [candidate division KSB1 bacterium]|nr:hypothetical protein [candidate division KSB1 bacterium]
MLVCYKHRSLPARIDGTTIGENRDDLIDLLFTEYGIKCVVQYYPLYRYDLFQKDGYATAACPETDRFFDNMLSFPFGTDLTENDMSYLIESIDNAITKLKE